MVENDKDDQYADLWKPGGFMGGMALDDMTCITELRIIAQNESHLKRLRQSSEYQAAKKLKLEVREERLKDHKISLMIEIPNNRPYPHLYTSPNQDKFEALVKEFRMKKE